MLETSLKGVTGVGTLPGVPDAGAPPLPELPQPQTRTELANLAAGTLANLPPAGGDVAESARACSYSYACR